MPLAFVVLKKNAEVAPEQVAKDCVKLVRDSWYGGADGDANICLPRAAGVKHVVDVSRSVRDGCMRIRLPSSRLTSCAHLLNPQMIVSVFVFVFTCVSTAA